jgi:hypothetical protein
MALDDAEPGPLGAWIQAQNSNIGGWSGTLLSGARA